MKKLFLIIIFNLILINTASSQRPLKQNNDSLWYFYPFSLDFSAGIWTPIDKLSKFYNASPQFGFGFGLMLHKKLRFQILLMPRFLNQKKPILINVDNSVVAFKKNMTGASFGGYIDYTFNQNKIASTELMTGFSWDDISTNILKTNKKDSISISGLGLSIGINSWFNIFKKVNLGFRALYTYSTYNQSKYLAIPIGGHSVTCSIVFRSHGRSKENKKWY